MKVTCHIVKVTHHFVKVTCPIVEVTCHIVKVTFHISPSHILEISTRKRVYVQHITMFVFGL